MTMTDAGEMLEQIKEDMGLTGTYHDRKLTSCINEVIRFMRSSGVSDDKINSSVGVVSRGTSDLFYNRSDYSAAFYIALGQLKRESEVGNVQT